MAPRPPLLPQATVFPGGPGSALDLPEVTVQHLDQQRAPGVLRGRPVLGGRERLRLTASQVRFPEPAPRDARPHICIHELGERGVPRWLSAARCSADSVHSHQALTQARLRAAKPRGLAVGAQIQMSGPAPRSPRELRVPLLSPAASPDLSAHHPTTWQGMLCSPRISALPRPRTRPPCVHLFICIP